MRILLTTLLILFTAPVLMAQSADFDKWDTDNDGLIERYEFASKFVAEYFSTWNADNEKGLIEEGFFKETYAGLDTDNDNFLSDEEWMVGYNYFYDDYLVFDDIAYVDSDTDGMIDYAEYYDALYDTDYFTDIDVDSDNYISEYELAYYVFDNWDFDDSETLSRAEFNRFEWYYIDV